MKISNAIYILKKYEQCPLCGNKFVGNGEGTFDVNDVTFKKTCKCGWVLGGYEDADGYIVETVNTAGVSELKIKTAFNK